MKKILLLTALLFSLVSFAQKTTKQKDIQNLINAMQIKATMESMVIKGIETYKIQKPFVAQQVWDKIINEVDYSSYLNKVEVIFNNNYTQTEIKNLTASIKPNQLPQFKNIVQKQLYDAGNEFGKKFGALMKNNIATYRY
jgi:hypothetical protein